MRIKRGVTSHAKHKKLLRSTKGYRMTKRRLVRVAREAYLHAGEYAFAGRKNRKRDFRRLWITRISEAVKLRGLSYSSFIHKLKEANIELDRKVLADLVVEDPEVFEEVLDEVKSVN
ncbi:50S ribosomal protein L20 [Candidatus Gottesmanbacteria bacterium RIFCSPLOWO2_01_FULL_43_11b]|uniref:Large ribosomal subunit protein bL20 n=1 Tax=Candidatus Gottesmanbacteria bacterium RIFCSPLOWO2_01_FULL_43_11b TaxID=1798392 RepID=A0A1F6AFX5_9BACT|nr:MAG: 50S ribosomal protein L20 [Candidatus Gottesmanbacteria bacterium RIFCSPLOWO2_01_FULL_43_11b]